MTPTLKLRRKVILDHFAREFAEPVRLTRLRGCGGRRRRSRRTSSRRGSRSSPRRRCAARARTGRRRCRCRRGRGRRRRRGRPALQLVARDRDAVAVLRVRRMRKRDTDLRVRPHHEAGAVEPARRRARPTRTAVPSCDIAMLATLLCVGGGATTVSAAGAIAETPTTVSGCRCWAACCGREPRLRLARHLQLPRGVGRDQLRDLALDRREQTVLLGRSSTRSSCLAAARRATTLRLRRTSVREQRTVTLHGGAERLHLREDSRVERGDALRAVHAVDHVVEVLRAENHFERRRLVRRVERRRGALRSCVWLSCRLSLRDLQLMTVLAQVALNLRELRCRRVVLRARALERVGELLQLPHDLLRLCSLR